MVAIRIIHGGEMMHFPVEIPFRQKV